MNQIERWPRRKLKFLSTINDEALTDDTDPFLEINYIDIGNVESSGQINNIVNYRFENAPSRARRIVREGDVIISTVRTYLEAIASIENPPENLIVSTGFAVIRAKQDLLDTAFCKYAMRERGFIHEVVSRSVGISYPAINSTELGDIDIPVPPISEQRRISAYLDNEVPNLDNLIAAKQRLIHLLSEKRRTLITQAVTKGLDSSMQMKDSGIPWLGEIPAHWHLIRLRFLLDSIEQGWSPQCDNFPASLDEWGVVKAGCVNGWTLNEIENKRLPSDLTVIHEYEIKAGDILMSRANTTDLLGSAVLVENIRPKLLLCDKIYRLKIKSESPINKQFVVYVLRSAFGRYQFEREATGASNSMQNIGQEIVTNCWIPVPPLDEQQHIVNHIKEVYARIDALWEATERTIKLLQERRTALISAAVTGKIPIESMNLFTGVSHAH